MLFGKYDNCSVKNYQFPRLSLFYPVCFKKNKKGNIIGMHWYVKSLDLIWLKISNILK